MNEAVSIAPRSWSRQQWVFVTLLLFVAQCAFLYFVALPPPTPVPKASPQTQLIFAGIVGPIIRKPGQALPPPIPTILDSRDLRRRESSAVLYPLDDGPPAQRGLGIATRAEQLGSLPILGIPQRTNNSESLPEIPGTKPVKLRPTSRTTSQILGSLSARRILTKVPPLDWTSPEPLAPTIAEVMVNGAGVVISEKIVESSGNKSADALALEASKRVRFEALPGIRPATANNPTNLVWGRIQFRWGMPNPDEPANR